MGCDQNEMPNIGGDIVGPGDVYGCEGAVLYDWDNLEFATSLDENETTWIAFNLEETTLFNVSIDQAGFQCAIFDGCDGELGLPPPEYIFESAGNSQEVGILTTGVYYMEITNLRNRVDFTFSIALNNITYGCTNNDALNYDETANVDDGSCVLQDCTTDYWVDNYGECVNDCDGNCAPITWIGDGYCDDGAWGVYDEDGNIVPINLMCEEHQWDLGDCEVIIEGCTETEIEDCNDNCAPDSWLGDGFCDDGSYEYNGNQIFFDCPEFNNDGGDCDGNFNRQQSQSKYPNGRNPIGQ
jgi:hypothetical protein